MNLSKLFFWIKKKKGSLSPTLPSHNFDQKLIKKMRSNLIPTWSQFRYLGSFLTNKEKITINISLAVLVLAILSWSAIWVIKNQTVVPASGGDYSEALIGQPKYINPLFASTNDVDADLSSLIYSSLFTYNNTEQKITPDLALDYTISNEGKTYDINLRQDVKWSDGEPLTADDVVYTFETIQDQEVGSPLITTFQGTTIERTGDYSVRFTLKEPFAPFLTSLTTGILPQHIWINIPPSGIRLAKNNLQPVGSGPWKFNKLTKDSSGNIQNYTLDRNPLYYKNQPHLKTLTFKFYTDFIQAASALKIKDISAVSFLPNDLTDKIAGKNFTSYEFELPQYTALFFNQDSNTILKDNDFRKALNLAIDKNSIITGALGNKGEVISSPILKGSLGFVAPTSTSFDPETANEILNKSWTKIQPEDYFKIEYEAAIKSKQDFFDEIKNNTSTPVEEAEAQIKKLEEEIGLGIRQGTETDQGMNPDQSFYRKNKNNEILTLSITTVDTPEYQQVAEAVAKMWRSIGIKTNVQIVGSSQISRDILRSRNYEILLYGEIVGADPDPYPFWHSSQVNYPGLNLSLFIDRSADKLLEDARATTTEATRSSNYEKFQEILAKEIPAIFLYTPTYNFVVSKEIKGINLKHIYSPSDRFNDLGDWYIKTKHQWKKD